MWRQTESGGRDVGVDIVGAPRDVGRAGAVRTADGPGVAVGGIHTGDATLCCQRQEALTVRPARETKGMLSVGVWPLVHSLVRRSHFTLSGRT